MWIKWEATQLPPKFLSIPTEELGSCAGRSKRTRSTGLERVCTIVRLRPHSAGVKQGGAPLEIRAGNQWQLRE